jgi:hypothetical protein
VETPWENVQPLTAEEWNHVRGKKVQWQEMVQFLKNLQDGDNNDNDLSSSHDLVRKFAPDLLNGIAGALTHGIIHLGWAIDAENPWMIKEGLAYLNFCHIPVASLESKSVVETDALSSFLRISKEWHAHDLGNIWIAPTKARYDESFHPELVPAGFQWHLAKVLNDAHPVATKLPSWLQEKPLPEVWKDLYHLVALIYVGTRSSQKNGNFIILHLITSLWALENVCRVIDNDDVTRSALESYWAVAICTLSASSAGFPTTKQLEMAFQEFPLEEEAVDDENFDWTEIVKRGCAEQEEHNIKLVYVCKELWNRYGRWKAFSEAAQSFTLTPNITPATTKYVV